MRTAVLISAAALTLSACQTLAPYGQASRPGEQGWTQQQIERTRWRVAYRGDGDAAVVSDRALRRAAELTLEQGHDWFVVDGRIVEAGRPGGARPSVSVGAGSSRHGRYSASGVGVGLGFSFGGGGPSEAVLDIRMGSGPRPADAHDAREVSQTLHER